ncbi:MAG: HlyD family secretion protein [Rhodobiaceae bacterium]|nr:HlyD family secretion protein [Rhodobiaceae bacterium]
MRSPQTSGADSAKGDAGRARAMRAAIGAAIIVAAAAAYFVWSWYADRHPSTNDAYVGAHVVRIAPQVTGKVAAVHVASYSAVKKGDVLVDLDAAPFEATVRSAEADVEMARQQARSLESAVAEARAQLAASEAALTDARSDWERVSRLVKAGSMAKAQGDTQKSTFRQAEAQFQAAQATLNKAQAALGSPGDSNAAVLAAQAKLDQARLDLSHTRIVAPADGFVGEVETRPGSFANTGTELLQLVDTGEWWVDANFKEGDLERIRPSQPATVTVDMLPGAKLAGHVMALSPASGAAFSLFPPENATGNWVKVTQRFPVRVRLDPAPALADIRVGGSATVTIDTTGATTGAGQ